MQPTGIRPLSVSMLLFTALLAAPSHASSAGVRIHTATFPPECSACHGDATSPSPIGHAYPNRAGSHVAHVRVYRYDCILCHNTPEGPGGSGHFDFVAPADVRLATAHALVGAGGAYDVASRACSSVYCHAPAGPVAASPPRWGEPESVFCGSCHRAEVHAPGDFNRDGILDNHDLLIFSMQWNAGASPAPRPEDLDHNDLVDGADLLLLIANWHNAVGRLDLGGSHAAHFDGIRGPGITECTVCHPDNEQTHTPRDGVVLFADGEDLAGTGVCNGCHGATAQSKPAWGGSVACLDCHNTSHPGNTRKDGTGLSAPAMDRYYSTSGHGVPTETEFAYTRNRGAGLGNCLPCHESYPTQGRHISGVLGDYTRLASVPSDELAYTAATSELCLTCHRPGQDATGPLGLDAAAEAMVHSAGVSGNYGTLAEAAHAFPAYGDLDNWAAHPGYGCETCHNPHGTANLAMIREAVEGRLGGESGASPVVLTATSPGWAQAEGNGICQACHRAGGPAHPDTAHPGNHNLDADCRSCHKTHSDTFRPAVQESSCLACHATAQGTRRAVVADFMLRSHHVVGGATDSDCVVCHDASRHGSGTVRLRVAGGPTVEYTSNAALEPFCLGCHDADGADGDLFPFSDNRPVPNIAVGWNAASHKAAGLSCMGDGTTGCHGNGHGSLKKHLLAQPHLPPTAPAYAEEEEGFCYQCHDANGPAGSNIQAQFALAHRHDVAHADQAEHGSKLECVNCHNPHLATSQHPLIDPDQRTTAWTEGETGFCLKCHDGAAPAGVIFPGQSPGTGYNKGRFAGTPHDGSGKTCGNCHAPHGSAEVSLKTRRYDQLDSVTWSFGSPSYSLCWQCHDEAKTVRSSSGTNANNAFGTRHDKHVRGERASCIICHDVHFSYDAGEDGLISYVYPVKKGWSFSLGSQTQSSAFRDTGANRGSCYLTCHGETHNPLNYTGTETSTLK